MTVRTVPVVDVKLTGLMPLLTFRLAKHLSLPLSMTAGRIQNLLKLVLLERSAVSVGARKAKVYRGAARSRALRALGRTLTRALKKHGKDTVQQLERLLRKKSCETDHRAGGATDVGTIQTLISLKDVGAMIPACILKT